MPINTMTITATSANLLAQFGPGAREERVSEYEVIESIQTALRDGSGAIPLDGVAWSIVALLMFAGSIKLYKLYRSHKLTSGPYVIFHRLAHANGLSIAQEWLLIRLARRQNLPSALTLILSGDTLAHHARAVAADTPPRRGRVMLKHVNRVHQILFNKPMPIEAVNTTNADQNENIE